MGLYYLQTNIICIAVLVIVALVLQKRKGAISTRRMIFYRLIRITILICISDIFAWFTIGKTFPGARAFLHFWNMVYDGAITWAGYTWLQYVILRTTALEDSGGKKKNLLMAVPLLIMVVFLLINPLTEFLFSISADNVYQRGGGIVIHWIISWGYMLAGTIVTFRAMHNAKSKVERNLLRPLLWFIVPPVIAAAAQMFFYGVTSTQCGMTLAILIIAVTFMTDEVSKDSLTGLNNRRALDNHILEKLQRGSQNMTVMMCDVDKFKTINDTLGHTVGDMVLKRMSDVLKRACGATKAPVFLCRFGGDEFIICGTNLEENVCGQMKESIAEQLAALNTEFGEKLTFSMSVGCASGLCSSYEDVEKLLEQADVVMYEDKKARNMARR